MTQIFKTEYHSIPTLGKSGLEAITAEEKVTLLTTEFEEVYNIELTNTKQENVTKTVKDYMENLPNAEVYKFYTTPKEITNNIKKLPS